MPMISPSRLCVFFWALFLLAVCPGFQHRAQGSPNPDAYWKVDDVRPGMKGEGRTVMKGTKIETFQAEVLGVLRNTSPGRDMILCRLAGLGLEKTGVIAGMSGSPIYIQGKLLGAVAFAWPYGKEPLAGITPFSQMERYVASYEMHDLAVKQKRENKGTKANKGIKGIKEKPATGPARPELQGRAPGRFGLTQPLTLDGLSYDTVTISNDYTEPRPRPSDGLWMVPLRTPLAVTGMSQRSLGWLQDRLGEFGMVPMQGGAVSSRSLTEEERNVTLQPGGALTVSLVTGDYDMSAIGTVTHIEGKRVYGWGHPFFGVGSCEFPLMTGYVHAICARQSISFKMGSPLRAVGTINADVSTAIAGWLDRDADMLPVSATVRRETSGPARTFHCKVARQPAMMGMLVFTVLANSIDMEGDLPEETTAHVKIVLDVEGRTPIVMEDDFSGSPAAGNRAQQSLFGQVPTLINLLTYNSFGSVRLNRVECTADICPGRHTADIEAVELDSDVFAPGDTVKATAFLRPYKGLRQRVPLALKLPSDLPEGSYSATVSDELTSTRQDLRDNPNLSNPPDLEHLFKAVNLQIAARRKSLVLRVPTQAVGVALSGTSLPDLPPSMVQILAASRRTGVQTISGALTAQQPTDWVVQGSETVHFTVARNKRSTTE